jgi:hypothetical protein
MELSQLGRPPTTLTGHNLINILLIGYRADQDGLQHALLTNRFNQIIDLLFVKAMARLEATRPDLLNRQSLNASALSYLPVLKHFLGIIA